MTGAGKKRDGVIRILLLVLLAGAILAAGVYMWQSRKELKFADCLKETVYILNGEEVPLEQLGFYVAYEERIVEEQAMIYHPENTKDYWNLHVDGTFVQLKAKDTVLEMAIHDRLFYRMAKEENMTLDAKEQKACENATMDFWMDLLDGQKENLPVSDEYIVEAIRQAALAQKYQKSLAEKNGKSYASYNWDGSEYQSLKEEQDLTICTSLWDRIRIGDVTLRHGSPDVVNGHTGT